VPTPSIYATDPDNPEILELLAQSDAYMAALYPAESNHLLDLRALQRPDVTFLVAQVEGRIHGCGALVPAGDRSWAEIKRMFVAPAARGQRLGHRLLEALEAAARQQQLALLRLETGIHQPEAIALYRAAGFREIAPFGDYRPDPLSLFMEKRLDLTTVIAPASESC
jgi:putative acetyltransferase